MFSDSDIAKGFSCGEKKTAYVCCFGLAPYFRSQLFEMTVGPFVFLFDESLCQTTQSKQMDAYVRQWDPNKQMVATQFLGSVFMGHGRAEDLVKHFHEVCGRLNENNILQIGMDGPNVNWKFYDNIKQEIESPDSPKLLDLGSCGLHTVQIAFKKAFEDNWNLDTFLKCFHRLFKDSPARREDYTRFSGLETFPTKFCVCHWVENVSVANRALDILQSVMLYVEVSVQEKIAPKHKTFYTVKEGCEDPLTKAKLLFFGSVARQFEKFLVRYQTEKPMVPHLSGDLLTLIKELMTRFVNRSVLKKSSTPLKLIGVNFEKDSVNYEEIDIGYAADKETKQLLATEKISQKMLLEFRMECKEVLIKATTLLLEKCTLKYSLVRNLACLDPREIAKNPEDSKAKFRRVVNKLDNAKRVKTKDCDDLLWQYNQFVSEVACASKSKYVDYDPYSEARLDTFFCEEIGTANEYSLLFDVDQDLFVLVTWTGHY